MDFSSILQLTEILSYRSSGNDNPASEILRYQSKDVPFLRTNIT